MKKMLRALCCACALALLPACGVLKSADAGKLPGLDGFTRGLAEAGYEVSLSASKAEPHEVNIAIDLPAGMDSASALSVLLQTMDFLQEKEVMRHFARQEEPYAGFPGVYNIRAETRVHALHLGYSPAYGADNGGALGGPFYGVLTLRDKESDAERSIPLKMAGGEIVNRDTGADFVVEEWVYP